jgi:hypothetical protein
MKRFDFNAMRPESQRHVHSNLFVATEVCLVAALLFVLPACEGDDGDTGPPGPPGPPGSTGETPLGPDDPLPGVVVDVTSVSGGTGSSGQARVGDRLTVQFYVDNDAGEALALSGFTSGSIYVSGPTSNYQRVIASQSDVLTRATQLAAGTYSYTFAVPIPSTYLAPLNDTPSLTEGELTGEVLLNGTYTVGIELRKDFEVDDEVLRDVGNGSRDFLFGTATMIESREVVLLESCNACHTHLQAHGGNRNDVKNCLLCHTAGAEDRNTPGVAGGTPGASIEFAVMIHKIHAGANLPSVMGMTTDVNGDRVYNATPRPYQLIGFNDSLHDYSTVLFPQFPSSASPMPRDAGYSLLASGDQSLENLQRSGPVGCAKCHGDPDGAGPIEAPAQGDRIHTHPTRRACASCHDDWIPEQPYTANGQTMPAVADDSNCTLCHEPSGNSLAIEDAHRHPLVDPALALGVNFVIESVEDAGGDNDGTFDEGELVRMTFRVEDDAGAPIDASTLGRIEPILSGPTTNPQVLVYQRMAPDFFSGPGPYTVDLSDLAFYDPSGVSDGTLQVFTTSLAPHWNVSGAETTLQLRTGTGAASSLASTARVTQNFVDLVPGGGASFAIDDTLVIEDANMGQREYMRVQWVEDDRLWFGSRFQFDYKPNLLIEHPAGATVHAVTTADIPSTSWTLDTATGAISEVVEFGAGEVLASYTTSFRVPAVYPGALNDSPARGEDWGDWTGLSVIDGTYILDLHGGRSFSTSPAGEATSYTEGGLSAVAELLFGSATTIETVERVVGAAACNACHDEISAHGGNRRGFQACIQCHGAAGTEHTQAYQEQAPLSSPAISVEFRNSLHSAHADVFPSLPGGVQNCTACHGEGNTAWFEVAERVHPEQSVPTRAYYIACSSCHDSSAAVAHMEVNTSPSGAESCALCHGPDGQYPIERSHFLR